MDFRSVIASALESHSPIFLKLMFQKLDIQRADAASFVAGRCSLGITELEQILTYLGYRLER
jgi:hypothetical protein